MPFQPVGCHLLDLEGCGHRYRSGGTRYLADLLILRLELCLFNAPPQQFHLVMAWRP